MSSQTSVGETLSAASGEADYAGNRAGSANPLQAESGSFAVCTCQFPGCMNISNGYCKMHRIWLESLDAI